MNKLLLANFTRLKKDKAFWINLIVMFAFGAFIVVMNYLDSIKYGTPIALDNFIFGASTLIGIFCADFVSLFVGTEYSDGTIRNKLMIGHSRSAIYLANLITACAACLLFIAAFTLAVLGLGLPLLGAFEVIGPVYFAKTLLGIALMTIAFGTICTLLSMSIQNKAVAAIINILLVFAMLMAASYLLSVLSAPEFYDPRMFGDPTAEPIANPNYIGGFKRQLFEFLLDFLPAGQGLLYSSLSADHYWQMLLYSIIITIAGTGIGLMIFRKKDIK